MIDMYQPLMMWPYKVFPYGYNMCQYQLNIKISTFYVIYCYAITIEDTIETKNKCFSGDLLKNWRNKSHIHF